MYTYAGDANLLAKSTRMTISQSTPNYNKGASEFGYAKAISIDAQSMG